MLDTVLAIVLLAALLAIVGASCVALAYLIAGATVERLSDMGFEWPGRHPSVRLVLTALLAAGLVLLLWLGAGRERAPDDVPWDPRF